VYDALVFLSVENTLKAPVGATIVPGLILVGGEVPPVFKSYISIEEIEQIALVVAKASTENSGSAPFTVKL